MHISISHKFILLANPKCGSQSIRKMVKRYCEYRYHRTRPPGAPHPHSPALIAMEVVGSLGLEWDEFITITTIRNPWDRVVSTWHYADKSPHSKWHKLKEKAGGDFKRFVNKFPEKHGIQHFAGDGNGHLFVNHIIPIEQAPDRLPPIFEKLDLKWRRVPHTNKSREDFSYRDYYDDESRERVAFIFAKDIEIGGYSF